MWAWITVGIALLVLLFVAAIAYRIGIANGRAAQKLSQQWEQTNAAKQPAPVQSVIDGRAAEQLISAELLTLLVHRALGDGPGGSRSPGISPLTRKPAALTEPVDG